MRSNVSRASGVRRSVLALWSCLGLSLGTGLGLSLFSLLPARCSTAAPVPAPAPKVVTAPALTPATGPEEIVTETVEAAVPCRAGTAVITLEWVLRDRSAAQAAERSRLNCWELEQQLAALAVTDPDVDPPAPTVCRSRLTVLRDDGGADPAEDVYTATAAITITVGEPNIFLDKVLEAARSAAGKSTGRLTVTAVRFVPGPVDRMEARRAAIARADEAVLNQAAAHAAALGGRLGPLLDSRAEPAAAAVPHYVGDRRPEPAADTVAVRVTSRWRLIRSAPVTPAAGPASPGRGD